MKQGVLQDESMEIHVASMSNDGEQQEHEKNNRKIEENSGEEETKRKLKQDTSMDQEPYPNQEDGCTKGLDGSRYQLIDVLGGGDEGNPWRMIRRSWNAAEFREEDVTSSPNGGFGEDQE